MVVKAKLQFDTLYLASYILDAVRFELRKWSLRL